MIISCGIWWRSVEVLQVGGSKISPPKKLRKKRYGPVDSGSNVYVYIYIYISNIFSTNIIPGIFVEVTNFEEPFDLGIGQLALNRLV